MALFGHEIGINSNNSLRSAMGKAQENDSKIIFKR